MEGPEIARYPRDLQRLCGCLVWRHVSWEQWLGVDFSPHASRRGAESVRGQEEMPGETAGPAKTPRHAHPFSTVAPFEAEAVGMVGLRPGGEFDGPFSCGLPCSPTSWRGRERRPSRAVQGLRGCGGLSLQCSSSERS